MTREILNQIAKAKKINLSEYMKVAAFINEAYTFIYVKFYDEQGTGFNRTRFNEKVVKLSISAIQKKGDTYPEQYETRHGIGQYIYEII